MIPAAHLTEPLCAEIQGFLPAIADLPLIAEVCAVAVDRARDVREQRVEVDLHAIELRLEQRTEHEFVAFVAVVRQLEFGDEADVDRIFADFGQQELVLPLERVEGGCETLRASL